MSMQSVRKFGTTLPSVRELTEAVEQEVRQTSEDLEQDLEASESGDEHLDVVDVSENERPVGSSVEEKPMISEREAWKAAPRSVKENVNAKLPRVKGRSKDYSGVSQKVSQASTSVIRGIPKTAIQIMRREFGTSDMNLLDLFMVHLYCHVDAESRVELQSCMTERQLDLVSFYCGSEMEGVQNKLDQVLSRLSKLEQTSVVMELLSGFVAFDRLGFRQDDFRIPSEVNFLENGVTDLMEVARLQSRSYKKRMDYIEGTPKR